MKNLVHFFIFLLILGCSSSTSKVVLFDKKQNLINKDLEKLLKITEQSHNGTLSSIVQATQEKNTGWIRTGERWNKQTKQFSLGQRKKIKELAHRLGYIQSKSPSKYKYDRVLLLGAASLRIESRLNYLIDLWKKGVRFDKIIMLGSTRSLDAPEEDAMLKPKVIEKGLEENETGLMKYIYNYLIDIPKEMHSIPILWIKADGKNGKRPNTNDTIESWITTDKRLSEKMAILSISNQPHASYQGTVIDTYLKKHQAPLHLYSEVVGEESSIFSKEEPNDQEIAILLDAIARHLYSLEKFLQTK